MLFLGYWSAWFFLLLILVLARKITMKENALMSLLFFSFLFAVPTTLLHMTFSDIRIFLVVAVIVGAWFYFRRKKRGRHV